MVAGVAEQRTHLPVVVRVIDRQTAVTRLAGTDRTASILCFEQSSVLSGFESIGLLNVPFVGAFGPCPCFGSGLPLRLRRRTSRWLCWHDSGSWVRC